jgi:hypothetical protein
MYIEFSVQCIAEPSGQNEAAEAAFKVKESIY